MAAHIFREYNDDADQLTHVAREMGDVYHESEDDGMPMRLWGQWDGGKDKDKVAYGWKLWKHADPVGDWFGGEGFGGSLWEERALEAACISNLASVTDAELTGAEKLLNAAARTWKLNDSSKRQQRGTETWRQTDKRSRLCLGVDCTTEASKPGTAQGKRRAETLLEGGAQSRTRLSRSSSEWKPDVD